MWINLLDAAYKDFILRIFISLETALASSAYRPLNFGPDKKFKEDVSDNFVELQKSVK